MAMARHAAVLDLLSRRGGILRLRPTLVHRFYPDLNRLGQKKLKTSPRQFIPERWIGSSVEAVNPPPMPGGGLAMLADVPEASEPLSLRDAIRASPEAMVGERILKRHGAEFRVLVKLLDAGEPIPFHIHANDRDVKRLPRHFPGQRFGKDEAYYFLDAPKGPIPYTHVGLYAGVGRKELLAAVKRGPQHALELSPPIHQEFEHGFFLPAGVPHRPGTALTLEIQQPSDVYTLLETHAAGKPMSPEQIHPGFKSLDEAFGLIDLPLSLKVGKMEGFRLAPQGVSRSRGGEAAWVFPPEICRKFAGQRIRVHSRFDYRASAPMVLWVWRGAGSINGRRVKAGDELFVSASAPDSLDVISAGEEALEVFSFSPGA